jgi:hypothetical protein
MQYFSLLPFLIFFAIYAVVVFFDLRHFLRTMTSDNWPRAMASISRDFVAWTKSGYVSYFRYKFTVDGKTFTGRFVIEGVHQMAGALQEKLNGLPVQVKYKPTNPKVSLLADYYDARFEGGLATQYPVSFLFPVTADSNFQLRLNSPKK